MERWGLKGIVGKLVRPLIPPPVTVVPMVNSSAFAPLVTGRVGSGRYGVKVYKLISYLPELGGPLK